MANRFEKAAHKDKKPAGGELPEELTAGTEQIREMATDATPVAPVAAEEKPAEAVVAPAAVVTEVAAPVQEASAPEAKPDGLVSIYQTKMGAEPEPRNIRLQAVITPSLNAKLNELVTRGEIKSRNDLINFLLERYFKEVEKNKS